MTDPQPKNSRSGSRGFSIGLVLLLVAVAALVLWQNGSQNDGGPPTGPTVAANATGPSDSAAASTPDAAEQVSDLPPIDYEDLPPEAQETIALIDEDGPFPYDKDGSTFQNREGLLPDQPAGYYAEYTVITPGSPDRGARRIVAGEAGEMYYTDDHYASFQEVIR